MQYYDGRNYHSLELMVIDHNVSLVKSWNIIGEGKGGEWPGDGCALVLCDFNNDGKVDISITYGLFSQLDSRMRQVTGSKIAVYSLIEHIIRKIWIGLWVCMILDVL